MTLHQPELSKQAQHYADIRKKLMGKPARQAPPPPAPIVDVPEIKPIPAPQRSRIFLPMWSIMDIQFDSHILTWRSYIEANFGDMLRENEALKEQIHIISRGEGYVPRPTGKDIIHDTLMRDFPGTTYSEIMSDRKTRDITFPRKICMFEVYRQRPDMSLPQIGRLFGKDHTTILHAVQSVEAMTEYGLRVEYEKYGSRCAKPPAVKREPSDYTRRRITEIKAASQ